MLFEVELISSLFFLINWTENRRY